MIEIATEAADLLTRMERLSLEAKKFESDKLTARKLGLKMSYMRRSLLLLNDTIPSVEGVINNDGVGGYEISSPTYSECRQFDAEDASSSPLFPRYMSSMPGQQQASTPPPDELSDGGTEPGVWPQDEEDCGAGNGEMGGAACPEVLLSSPPKRRRPKKAVAFVDSDIDGSLVVWIGSRSKVLHHVECHQVPK